MELPSVILRPGDADRVAAGHPWIYAGAVAHLAQPAEDGQLVQVRDHRKRLLGFGFYNSRSKIRVRIVALERPEIDAAFFETRFREALARRERFLPGARSFRLVNAEGDFLSGLIVDKYENVFVLQTSSLGMDQRKPLMIEALKRIFSPQAIVERNDMASRKLEGLPERSEVVEGQLPEELIAELNGLKFSVDLRGGHKTGLYLDQQLNYQAVAQYAAGGAHALDCFSFAGGFSLHAARAGAARVRGIDQSEEAVAAARRHAELNQLSARCEFEAANVFDWLKAQTTTAPHEKLIPRYDLIILDPPSFTRSRSAIPDAIRGYKEIHLRALKLLKRGGILATFCCSHHIDANLFMEVILAAAFDARKILRRAAIFSQAPDHPVLPSVPETEYLKGYALELA